MIFLLNKNKSEYKIRRLLQMKPKILFLILFALLISLLVIGCGKKIVEIKKVGELSQYKDPVYSFEVSYPKDWTKNNEIGTARFYPDQNSIGRFADPFTGAGQGGVQIKVAVEKTVETLVKVAKNYRDTMVAERRKIDGEEKIKVDGQDAIKIFLTSNFGKENVQKSFRIFIATDSLVTYIDCAAFNQDWEAYAPIFDAVVQKVKIGKMPTAGGAKTSSAVEKPSDVFANYQTPYFSVSYPENFNFSSPPKGKNEFSVELKGERLDCTIRFDVFPAKGLTVDKVVNQNKAAYKAASGTPLTIDGVAAQYMNYSQQKNVNSRAYFIVKNDKVIRITLNWFTPESDTYKPVFEKVVNSMKLK
jgi:hypothetical protein